MLTLYIVFRIAQLSVGQSPVFKYNHIGNVRVALQCGAFSQRCCNGNTTM